MRFQSKSSIAYMFRNFWKLVYVALPVAVLMAFFANPTREIEFYAALLGGSLTFENVFPLFIKSMTIVRFGKLWWAALISLIVLAFGESMLIVKIDRHMRIGEMSALPFKRAAKLFPVVLLLVTCYFCVGEIAVLLSVGVMYIVRSTQNIAVIVTCGMSISFVLRVLWAWLFMLLCLAAPLKYSENYPLNIALSYSVRVMSKRQKWAWGASFLYALGRYAVMACGYYLRPFKTDIVLYTFVYLFVLLILPCFVYSVYYDVVGSERRDILKIMFN